MFHAQKLVGFHFIVLTDKRAFLYVEHSLHFYRCMGGEVGKFVNSVGN